MPSSDPIQRRDEVRFDSAIPPGWLPRIPASLQFYRDSYYSGEHRTQVINRLSSQLSGLSVTNQLRWNLYSNAANATDGDFQISSRLQRFGVRSSLLYTLKPESRWTNLNIALNGPLTGQFRFNSDFIRSFTSNLNTYTFGINRSVGRFAVGTNLSYNSADELTFNLTLSAGIGREPRQPQWLSAAQPMARSGISSLNVFLDNNLNGIRDPDEQPLDGIGFNVNGSTPSLRTDANGTAFLTNLPIYQQTDLAIATDTLEDPLWKPQLRGIRLVPRPGHTTRIDFPITITSEIDGTVYLQKGSHQQELADVSVELVAADGSIVQNVTSAYDGFYIISAIQAGNYTLRINPAQLQKYKLQSPAPVPIKVGNSGNFINGINILLSATETETETETAKTKTTEIQTVADRAEVVSVAADENSTPLQNDNLIGQYYVVKKGDWIWKIARRHLGHKKYAADIYKLNSLTITDPDLIQPGQRLLLPTSHRE